MFRSLRFRNYRLFFVGQFVSLVGSWMQQVAQSWLVYRLTHDAFHLGLVGFVSQFPVFLFSLYAGTIADRINRHRLVICTQALALCQAAAFSALTMTGSIELWHVYVLVAILGLINAFDVPTRQVLIGELVPPEHRHNAIALNSTIVNGSRLIGPAVAGLIIHFWGEGPCFIVNAVSYLAVLIALMRMKDVHVPKSESKESTWSQIRGGVSYVKSHDPIRIILLLLGVISVAGTPYSVLLPIFADQILNIGSSGYGLLTAFSGLGALLGALFLAGRQGVIGLERVVLWTTVVFGLALTAFSFSRTVWLSYPLMAVIGLGVMLQMAGVNTLLQHLSQDRFRGRVMGFYTMMCMGITPLGSLLAGKSAAVIGAPWTVTIGACICIVTAIRYIRFLPWLITKRGDVMVTLMMAE